MANEGFFFATTNNINNTFLDGFGRLRVSNPETLFDLSHVYDKQPALVEELTATGATGTHNSNLACVQMAVTSTTGSRIVRQTKRYFTYQPGKSLQILATGVMSTVSNGTFRIMKRSYISGTQVDTPVTTFLNKTSDLDFTKSQIFLIDSIEWLGVGSVVLGVIIDGQKRILAKFNNANLNPSVYMRKASLPIRYEIEKTSTGTICRIGYFDNHSDKSVDSGGDGFFFEYETTTASADTMQMICATVISEGGYNQKGKEYSIDSGATAISVNAERPVLSLRMKAGYNRGTLIPLGLSMLATSASNYIYRVYYGGTLTGASFGTVNANSATEFDVSATALTGGIKIKSGYVSTQVRDTTQTFDGNLLPGVSIAGVPEIVTITAQNLSGGSASILTQMSFQEVI